MRWSKTQWRRSWRSTQERDWEQNLACMRKNKARYRNRVYGRVGVCILRKSGALYEQSESWEIREGLVSWTPRHLFSLFCTPPFFLSLNYKCPPTLGSGDSWMEGGMRGFHLLFINTGSGNTPHCQPNPLSLHLVPWQRGGCQDQVQSPRCCMDDEDRVG